MKHNNILIFTSIIAVMLLLASCNKDLEQFAENPAVPSSGPTLDEMLSSNPSDSLYYKMIKRIGLNAVLADSNKIHTLFVPSNEALKPVLSAIAAQANPPVIFPPGTPDAVFSAFISQMPIDIVAGLVYYNTVPQKLFSLSIGNSFPNFIYPTILNPKPDVSLLIGPVIRLALYPSTANGAWLNNVPITQVDSLASNGVIHHTASIAIPPQRSLWERIKQDPELTYLKAAIERADSGVVRQEDSLIYNLNRFGPDFTLFAPVDSAFKSFIISTLVSQGGASVPQAQFIVNTFGTTLLTNPYSIPLIGAQLGAIISPQNVLGILAYHVMTARAYTNNFSTEEKAYTTFLNTVVAAHPGLKIKASFTPPNPFVSSLTIDDANPLTPQVSVNINNAPLLPDPLGTSDQTFINGVLHKVNRVLLPF